MPTSYAVRQDTIEMAEALSRWEKDGGARAHSSGQSWHGPAARIADEEILREIAARQALELERYDDAAASTSYRLTGYSDPDPSDRQPHDKTEFKLAFEDVITILMNRNVA